MMKAIFARWVGYQLNYEVWYINEDGTKKTNGFCGSFFSQSMARMYINNQIRMTA